MKKVLLINGPNLNFLGQREPEIYGNTGLREIEANLTRKFEKREMRLVCFQSNHEGDIVDFIQTHQDAAYVIINPAALTHTSVAIPDALLALATPFVELHLSNVHAREPFRSRSYFSPYAKGIITGLGVRGYELAADFVIGQLG